MRLGLDGAQNARARGGSTIMAEAKDVKTAFQRELQGLVKARDELKQQVEQAKNDVVDE